MNNQIGSDFTFKSFLRFTLPSMIMMFFISIYSTVDGLFISNYVNADALSGLNIVWPIFNVIFSIIIMFASGGSAIIAKKIGEKKPKEANKNFTLLIIISLILGMILAVVGIIFLKPIVRLLGATDTLFQYAYDYGYYLLFFTPFIVLKTLYEYFLITAGNPKIGLLNTVLGGVINLVLDYIFIVHCNMGIAGASIATGIGFLIPAIIGTAYFLRKDANLKFTKTKLDFKLIIEAAINGSSEMVSNATLGIITVLFNMLMLNAYGENGVAAISIIIYIQYAFAAIFFGFASGAAPVIAYNYGEKNKILIKRLISYCFKFIGITTVIIILISIFSSSALIRLFTKDPDVIAITESGIILYSLCYLTMGFNIMASAMFTAFSNGKVSAIISMLRSFVFVILCLKFLPLILPQAGLWLSIPIAEFLSVIISFMYIKKYKDIYGY